MKRDHSLALASVLIGTSSAAVIAQSCWTVNDVESPCYAQRDATEICNNGAACIDLVTGDHRQNVAVSGATSGGSGPAQGGQTSCNVRRASCGDYSCITSSVGIHPNGWDFYEEGVQGSCGGSGSGGGGGGDDGDCSGPVIIPDPFCDGGSGGRS